MRFSLCARITVIFTTLLVLPLSVDALSVTNVTVANTSPANELFASGNYRVREFRSGTVATSPVTVNGAEHSFSNQFGFLMSHRVNQPEGPNFALIYLRTLGYAMNFTVEDPLNEGYTIDIDHHLRGYVTVSREEPVTVGVSGGGTMLGSFDDGSGPVVQVGLNVFGDGLTIHGTDPESFGNKLIDKTFSGYTSPVYTGTRTFTVAFSSHPSPALTSVIGNFGGGETEARFGLLPTHASSGDPSRPDFLYAEVPGDLTPSDLGHFLDIHVTSQNPPDVCSLLEEKCDGIDNDCDDEIDEDFSDLGASCTAGIGECLRTGTIECAPDGGSAMCNAQSGEPQPELCDGRDNDCNALIDDADTDSDGVLECQGEDLCLATVLPERAPTSGRLNPNHYTQLDADSAFEVGCSGKNCTPIDGSITLEDTFGCSCEQILASLPGNNTGLLRYGCSPGIMLEWMSRGQELL